MASQSSDILFSPPQIEDSLDAQMSRVRRDGFWDFRKCPNRMRPCHSRCDTTCIRRSNRRWRAPRFHMARNHQASAYTLARVAREVGPPSIRHLQRILLGTVLSAPWELVWLYKPRRVDFNSHGSSSLA